MTEQLRLDVLSDPAKPAPKPAPSFHVRSHTTVEEAEAGEAQAQTQEAAILQWFRMQDKCVPGVRFRPSQVHEVFTQWPIGSIRRALTNLTQANPSHLTHWPGHREEGPYGAKESSWSLSIFDEANPVSASFVRRTR